MYIFKHKVVAVLNWTKFWCNSQHHDCWLKTSKQYKFNSVTTVKRQKGKKKWGKRNLMLVKSLVCFPYYLRQKWKEQNAEVLGLNPNWCKIFYVLISFCLSHYFLPLGLNSHYFFKVFFFTIVVSFCLCCFFLNISWWNIHFQFNYWGYGFEVLQHLNGNWMDIDRFPRVVLCDFEIRQMQNIQTFSLQVVQLIKPDLFSIPFNPSSHHLATICNNKKKRASHLINVFLW